MASAMVRQRSIDANDQVHGGNDRSRIFKAIDFIPEEFDIGISRQNHDRIRDKITEQQLHLRLIKIGGITLII